MRRAQQVRRFGGHSAEDAIKDMTMARKACYGGAAVCGALCLIVLLFT